MERIARLKEYLKTAGEDSFLQHALALEYVKAGNDPEAKILFSEVLRRDPAYLGSYYHLGKLLERMGDLPGALQVYGRGMEMAASAADHHTYGELQAAFEDAEDLL